jgi:glycosyltransferase involved in cell wall biosynthesis
MAGVKVRVSIVIGSYNRRTFLQKAIDSVRDNGIGFPYETIVVDGGSTDGALDWLIQQKDVITIVQHNRGEYRGRPIARRSWGYFMNLGFKATQGEFVVMISDDSLLLPEAVNRGVERLESMRKAGRNVAAAAFYFRNWPREERYYVQLTLGAKLFVNHGIYLRRVMEEVGWAEEDAYVFYKSDGDLCLKMWRAGYEVVDCPGAYVEHFDSANPELRETNRAVLQHDREAYIRRWKGTYDALPLGAGQNLYVEFKDPQETARRLLGSVEMQNGVSR